MAAVSSKIFLLTTLYRTKEDKQKPMILVSSYKTDPRGEEFIAEFELCTKVDLTTRFTNRIIYYRGQGSFIPLINSRVLLDIERRRTVYAGFFTPHPYSEDFRNPFSRSSDPENMKRRISVGTIDTVNGPLSSRSFAHADVNDLKDLFQMDVEKLERRPKAKPPQTTNPSQDSKKKNDSRKRAEVEDVGEIDNLSELCPSSCASEITLGASHEREDDRRRNEKVRKLITKCKNICIQNSAIYDESEFVITRDIKDSFELLVDTASVMSDRYLDSLKVESVGGAKAIFINKEKRVIGFTDLIPRKLGVMVNEGLAIVFVDCSASSILEIY